MDPLREERKRRTRKILILLTSVILVAGTKVISLSLQALGWKTPHGPPQNSTISTLANESQNGRQLSQPSYIPGNLTVLQEGLLLSQGLSARLIATSGEFVKYDKGGRSSIRFHLLPDAGATFEDPRPGNKGGWIYVSNSEVRRPFNLGGVGSLTFDKKGRLIDYRMVLENSTANCAGGRTPWNSWVSCEEYTKGMIWQVDPTGERPARTITLGSDGGGWFESFAYDARHSHYFVTEDHELGPLRRFIPTFLNHTDSWEELHGDGETTYLVLNQTSRTRGTYEWIRDKEKAKSYVNATYPHAEGLDVFGNELFFVSKRLKRIFILNLDDGTYLSRSTKSGLFDGQPDQLQRILGTDDDLLYYTEDGGQYAGVHVRDRLGQVFTILESPIYSDETTGLAFSPNGMHLYIAYQVNGTLFDVTRDDGLAFHAKTLNVKYHNKK